MKEFQKHKDAFLLFYKLLAEGKSVSDSIVSVAEKFEVTERTVWSWHKKLSWNDKRAIKDAELNKGVEERLNSSIIENKILYLGLVHSPINDMIDKVNKGEVPVLIENANDLDRILKIALLLQDQPTEKTERKTEDKSIVKVVGDLFQIAEEGMEKHDIHEDEEEDENAADES
jgi:hypothetical protein